MSRSLLRRFVPIAATVLALGWQTACSSDDGDDDDGGNGGSSGSGTGGASPCAQPCSEGESCSPCFNPENPDEPLYGCIPDGTSC